MHKQTQTAITIGPACSCYRWISPALQMAHELHKSSARQVGRLFHVTKALQRAAQTQTAIIIGPARRHRQPHLHQKQVKPKLQFQECWRRKCKLPKSSTTIMVTLHRMTLEDLQDSAWDPHSSLCRWNARIITRMYSCWEMDPSLEANPFHGAEE